LPPHGEFNVLSPDLAARMEAFRLKVSVLNAGYRVLTDWHPLIPPGWGEFPAAPVERSVVYRGDAATWAYSHHQAITKFNDRYVASWSNGFLHEDYVGQEVHLASSEDGRRWSTPQVVAPTPVESGLVRTNAGLCAAGGRLYNYVCVANDFGRDATPPGTFSLAQDQRIRLDAYSTTDLVNWTHHENLCDDVYLLEGPRPTRDGRYMCCGFEIATHSAVVLIWENAARLAEPPRTVRISPSPGGPLPEEGTWYQTADGRIRMYQRDSTLSCRLALSWSDDGGETWSDLQRTDFRNSCSRAFAGSLPDGRCYIVGNNYDVLLDRRRLQIALSNDGSHFDRQYTLVESDSTRRVNGRHKEDGYQYPNCYADGDKLLVICSVNKEDVEVLTVDMNKAP
jgi:hypothetical protein